MTKNKVKKPKKPKTKSKVWRTFLKVDSALLGDTAPVADAAWLAARGIDEASPIVIGLLRRHVLPLFDNIDMSLESDNTVYRRWALVHNRESGVPTVESDKAAYIDLTIEFEKPCMFSPPAPFVMTTPKVLDSECAGWDVKLLVDGIEDVYGLLDQQFHLVRVFLGSFKDDVDDFTVMKHMRAFFHYQANLGQMRIS